MMYIVKYTQALLSNSEMSFNNKFDKWQVKVNKSDSELLVEQWTGGYNPNIQTNFSNILESGLWHYYLVLSLINRWRSILEFQIQL